MKRERLKQFLLSAKMYFGGVAFSFLLYYFSLHPKEYFNLEKIRLTNLLKSCSSISSCCKGTLGGTNL